MTPGAIGRALLARVQASTPPHSDALAADVQQAYDRLRENDARGLLTIGQFMAPLIFGPAYFISLPLFIGLTGMTVVGAGRLLLRSRRRKEEVRELARNARIVGARALPNGTQREGVLAYEVERRGRAYLRIEIIDGPRTLTAQLVRDRPRSFATMNFERFSVVYAQFSSAIIAFDSRGEMILGTLEEAPLPEARLLAR